MVVSGATRIASGVGGKRRSASETRNKKDSDVATLS